MPRNWTPYRRCCARVFAQHEKGMHEHKQRMREFDERLLKLVPAMGDFLRREQ